MTARLIPPRIPLVDARTGLIAREWYLYFLALGGDVDTMDGNALGFAPASVPVDINTASQYAFGIAPEAAPLDIAAAVQDAISLAPPLVPAAPVSSGGATVSGVATITITGAGAGQFEWVESVAAPGLVAGDYVQLHLVPGDDALENTPEMLDVVALAGRCTVNDTMSVLATFSTPTRGPIQLYYGVM